MSIIFVRTDEGSIRGFYNACTHRGNPVCLSTNGNTRRFTCSLHGWSFDRSGKLLSVPDKESFFDFDKADHNLAAVATEVWGNIVFFNLSPHSEQTLLVFLGEIANVFDTFPFSKFTSYFHVRSELRASWIAILDGARETYYVAALHRNSSARAFFNSRTPTGRLITARDYGYHAMASYWGNRDYRASPLEMLSASVARGPRIGGGKGVDDNGLPSGLNPARSPDWSLDAFSIFPNALLLTNGASLFIQQVWPVAVDRTIYDFMNLVEPARTAAERFAQHSNMSRSRDVLSEDMNTYERMHANFASGVVKSVTLSDQEVLVRHNYRAVERWVERHSKPAATSATATVK